MIKSKIIIFAFLLTIVSLSLNVSAHFYLAGYTKYTNGSNMSYTNVSISIINMTMQGMQTIAVLSNRSSPEGIFNLTVNNTYDNPSYMYQISLVRYNGTNGTGKYAEYIGQSLPQFPKMQMLQLQNSRTTFYLKKAITIDLSVVGNLHSGNIISYGKGHVLANDYSAGLFFENGSGGAFYDYINSSNYLIKVNPSTLVKNQSLKISNITNTVGVAQIAGNYYFLNKTKIERCSMGPSLKCNESTNITGNYTSVAGIGTMNGMSGKSIIVSGEKSGSNILEHFYSNLTYAGKQVINNSKGPLPAGFIVGDNQGHISFVANKSGVYELYDCDNNNGVMLNCGENDNAIINFTSGLKIGGLAFNSQNKSLYFSSGSSGNENITAFNTETDRFVFNYQVQDNSLGYPVKQNWGTNNAMNAIFSIPADENYSLMIYPNNGPGFPAKVDLTNLAAGKSVSLGGAGSRNITSVGSGLYVNLSNVNMTTGFVQLSGNINTTVGIKKLTKFTIIAYLLEGGNMIFAGSTLPANMGQWHMNSTGRDPINDTFNASSGFYNMTLPASVLGANLFLFATGSVNNSGTLKYYGGFRNVTLQLGNSTIHSTNFTMYPLLGTKSNISVGFEGDPSAKNVTTDEVAFNLTNGSAALSQAHIQIDINYPQSSFPGSNAQFTWVADAGTTDNGMVRIPLLNYSIKKMQVFTQQYAPLQEQLSKTSLQANPVKIILSHFSNTQPDGGTLNNIQMMMYMHKDDGSCSVPYPSHSCAPSQNASAFNPFSMVIGGGKLDLEIKEMTTNITVRYINVNLLASGPPNAMFDNQSNSSNGGLEEAWRFGSEGPDIYDYVLIGIPYNATAIKNSMNAYINITKFFGNSFSSPEWQQGKNSTSELSSTNYANYDSGAYTDYINGTGVLCSTSDINLTSGLCYRNETTHMLWFKIPHFSGIGPSITGQTIATSNNPGSGASSGGEGIPTTLPLPSTSYSWDKIFAHTPSGGNISVGALTSFTITTNKNVTNPSIEFSQINTTNISSPSSGGQVYQSFLITPTEINDSEITNVSLKFRINASWVKSNGLNASNVVLYRNSTSTGNKWVALPTELTSEDSEYYYYTAISPGFSTYTIFAGYQKNQNTNSLETNQQNNSSITQTTPEVTPSSWWEWVVIIVVAVIIIGIIYLLTKKKM